MTRIDRALARPDRRGLTTDGAEQARGRHALLRLIIRRTLQEEDAERASWTGRVAQLGAAAVSVSNPIATWPDEERVIAVLTDEERLVNTLRPFVPGGIDGASPWLIGGLHETLGPAIVAVALREARRRDADEPGTHGFYLATRAELAHSDGDDPLAARLATQALAALDAPGWGLVRARVSAIGGAAAESLGDMSAAMEHYANALEIDPNVFRRLGVSLPVRVRGTGGDAAEAADLLGRSPRFHASERGFALEVTEIPSGLRACLRTRQGNEIRCAEAARPIEPTAEAPADEGGADPAAAEDPEIADLTLAQRMAREVHRALFSARIELSTVDLRSLDGRTTGGSALANEQLREMLQQP